MDDVNKASEEFCKGSDIGNKFDPLPTPVYELVLTYIFPKKSAQPGSQIIFNDSHRFINFLKIGQSVAVREIFISELREALPSMVSTPEDLK